MSQCNTYFKHREVCTVHKYACICESEMRQERSLTEYVLLERNSISLFVIHELEEKKVVLSLTI